MLLVRAVGLSLLAWLGVEAWAGRVRRFDTLTWSVVAWSFVAVLATVFARSPHLSLLGEVTQREGLCTLLALAGLHLGVVHSHRAERDVRDTLRVVGLCALAAAAYAQLQLAGLDPIAWSGVHTYAVNGAIALRPAGPLGNPILLGIVLAAALPLALARLAEDASDPAWLVPAAALLSASLVMTLSRGAWLAAAAAGMVASGLSLAAGARRRRVGWTLAASLSPALLFGVARTWAPLVARLGEGLESHSVSERASIARGALQLWSERPWLGVGPDAFGLAFPRVQEPALWRAEWIGLPVHAHAVPLQVIATLGALGGVTGAAWLVAAVGSLWRAWRDLPSARATIAGTAGVIAALVAAGAVNVVGPAGAALFAVGTAFASALCPRPEPAAKAMRRMPRALPAVAAAVVCWAVLSLGVPELGALMLAQPARDGARLTDATPSEWRALATSRATSVQHAVAVWPHDDLLWRLASAASLAEAAAVGARDRDQGIAAEARALAAARRAIALAPGRAESHACLGDALAASALRTGAQATADSADAAYAGAGALAPADAWLMVAHARFQLARRDGVRALEVAQRITGLYPEAAVGHMLSGAALLLLGRAAEARAELLTARTARWEDDAGPQRAAVERLLTSVGQPQAIAKGASQGARGQRRQPPPRR